MKLSLAKKGKRVEECIGPEAGARLRWIWHNIGKQRAGKPRPDVAARNRDPKFTAYRLRHSNRSPNGSESRLLRIIEGHGLPFIYAGDRITVGTLKPDFIHKGGKQLAIEVFGQFFHDPSLNPKVSYGKTAKGRTEALLAHGWHCLILGSDEVIGLTENELVSRIKSFEEATWSW